MFSRIFLRGPRNMAPLAALSWMVTIKDLLGIEKVQLDKDPIKNKIKQSMMHRKYHRNDEAIDVLNEALVEAKATKCEEYISRVYDELANAYYEMENFEAAERLFREVIQRLIRLHGKNEESPEFIGVSLKLADIFAQKGDLESAEVGLKHCVSKQMKVMEEHQGKLLTGKQGHMVGSAFPVDELGFIYTDPIVLFAMSLEQYAHFLVDYCGEDRLKEAEEYMDEAVKISYYVYGMHDSQTVPFSMSWASNVFFEKGMIWRRSILG
uniref:Uncharacterized protein n=1 Tax=Ditylenchus dipsaci TaxID=166011 RepID=A0A915EMS2_9BILA